MAKVPNNVVGMYHKYYPELSKKQMRDVLDYVKTNFGRLDAVTVHYFAKEKYPKLQKVV